MRVRLSASLSSPPRLDLDCCCFGPFSAFHTCCMLALVAAKCRGCVKDALSCRRFTQPLAGTDLEPSDRPLCFVIPSFFPPSFLFLPRLLPAKAPVRWFARGFDNSAAATAATAAAAASQSLTIFEFTNAARPKNASSSSLNWFDGHGAARSAKELCFFDIVNWLKYYRGLSQVPEIANASFGGRTVFARRFSRAALQQRRRNGI